MEDDLAVCLSLVCQIVSCLLSEMPQGVEAESYVLHAGEEVNC